jgi:hypothetical protein
MPSRIRVLAPIVGALLASAASNVAPADTRRNVFGDPFVQLTRGAPACPVPEGPLYTEAEAREAAHDRSQRGVSCHLAGRCRLPNAYLYDREIAPRVVIAVEADGRFARTSVWALGQRRIVWLKGCVASGAEAAALEQLVRQIDDVEGVVNELMVGTAGKPPYRVAVP